jgi:propanediol dehydratase large subunit
LNLHSAVPAENELAERQPARANCWRRLDLWDPRELSKDRFAPEDPKSGFCAAQRPFDPVPSLAGQNRHVMHMDGKFRPDFDLIDEFICKLLK